MTEIFLKTKITLKNIYLIPFTQVLTGLRHSHIHTCVCAKWITKKTVFCFPIPIPLHPIIYEFIAQNLLPKVENREISLVKISILCNHCVIFILNRIKLRQANIALYIDTIASSIYSSIVQLQVNFFSFDNKIQLIEMPIVFHMKANFKKRLADPPPTHPNFLKKDWIKYISMG